MLDKDFEYNRWNKRWNGLSYIILEQIREIGGYEVAKRVPTLPTKENPRHKVVKQIEENGERHRNRQKKAKSDDRDFPFEAKILTAMSYLWLYAAERFAYFNTGFFLKGEGARLEHSVEMPPQYVLSEIYHKTARDFTIFQKLYSQRQTKAWREHLNRADYLAELSLRPAINSKLVPDAHIITYFQKETTIRITPYANIAMIGIPYSSLENPIDLLAIPHEVGHHVYVNGYFFEGGRETTLREHIVKQTAEYPYWIRQWIEEIFADVYGTIIAGPVAALSFQYLVYDKLPSSRVKDDGEHPVDIIRPRVYEYILRKLNGLNATATDDEDEVLKKAIAGGGDKQFIAAAIQTLKHRWSELNLGLPRQFKPKAKSLRVNEEEEGKFIRSEIAVEAIKTVISNNKGIDLLATELAKGRKKPDPKLEELFPFGDWGQMVHRKLKLSEKRPETLFANFEEDFESQFSKSAKDVSDAAKVVADQMAFSILYREPFSNQLLYNFAPKVVKNGKKEQARIPVSVWLTIFSGDWWGEHGPNTLGAGGGAGGG